LILDKEKLIEHYIAIDKAAGSVKEIWDVFEFTDNEYRQEGTPIRRSVAALIGSLILLRLKVFNDEYVRFNNFYRKPSIDLKNRMSDFRKLLKEYNVENVRNILIAHNRNKKNNDKLTTAEDITNLKIPSSFSDYNQLFGAMLFVMAEIQKAVLSECPEYKPVYRSHESKY
jgi:hypothetical protein